MDNKKQIISSRLKTMLNELGISQAEVCRSAGIDKGTLSLYINGKRTPQTAILLKICNTYGVDPSWVLGNDVPMFRSTKAVDDAMDKKLILDYLIDNDEIRTLIECYQNSDVTHRQELLSYAKYLLKR